MRGVRRISEDETRKYAQTVIDQMTRIDDVVVNRRYLGLNGEDVEIEIHGVIERTRD